MINGAILYMHHGRRVDRRTLQLHARFFLVVILCSDFVRDKMQWRVKSNLPRLRMGV